MYGRPYQIRSADATHFSGSVSQREDHLVEESTQIIYRDDAQCVPRHSYDAYCTRTIDDDI